MRRWSFIFFAILMCSNSCTLQKQFTSDQLAKCDHAVRILIDQGDDSAIEKRTSPSQGKLYHLIVQSTCNESLSKWVVQVTSTYGDYAVVWVTIAQIHALLKEPCVISIQAGERQYPSQKGGI